MYIPQHFKAYELVPPDVYEKYGEMALEFLDDRILMVADAVRNYFNVPVTINTYKNGGLFTQRGLRNIVQVGGDRYDPHFLGRAIDFDVQGKTADEVRSNILAAPTYDGFTLIRGIEMNVAWIHLDVANRPGTRIYQFNK
jgi:hypothetical protein